MIKIIGMNEMLELYPFTRKELTALLNTRGCPVLPRKSGGPYKVVQDEFEKWLRSCRKR